ncbi:MAG: ABC transporter permease subunit [Caldilineaceae bacterium]|nr:ABC transporter permease subunit [Caldilineaceae bacterium]
MQQDLGFSGHGRPPFWRDERILGLLSQLIVVLLVAGFLYFLYSNLMAALRVRFSNPISFDFWYQTAGFDIKESLIDYSRASTYGRAFLVGLLNTIIVAVLGVIFATLLGIVIGVMRLSKNFLVNRIATAYVDLFRNIPLLILLIFWSQAVFLKLPRVQDAVVLPGPIFLSQRGVAMPWGIPTDNWPQFLVILLGGVGLALLVSLILVQVSRRTRYKPVVSLWALLVFIAVAIGGWFAQPAPLTFSFPELVGFNTRGGRVLSPEFMAILSGLVIYTAAFIAEIVRSGIQAVSRGQREAAAALGLTGFQTLRLVIFPQALRIIIPPLTSQYLNLTKNSSLAIAVGYPDLFAVAGNTIRNQTGREIEVFLLVMGIYLSLSLITSVIMNVYNRQMRLVER